MNRNLSQISIIFLAIPLAILGGFVIICFGVARMLAAPDDVGANYSGLIVTASGILVEFIVATFLVIYRVTMKQAQGFVSMLERINAVGMSAQLIENVEGRRVDREMTPASTWRAASTNVYAC